MFEREKGRERESERLNRDDRREMHMNRDCNSAEGRRQRETHREGRIGEGSGEGREIGKREGEEKTLCVPSSGCAECRRIMALSCRVWAEKSSTNA